MQPQQPRVVICGGGVIGAAVAYFLAARGVPARIVERARPGAAASGHAGGFLALDWNDNTPIGPLARASFAMHRELATSLGVDVGYRELETLMVAGLDAGDVSRFRKLDSPRWLDGNVAVHSVIGTPATTAQVNPLQFTRALVDGAVARGAELVTGAVHGLERSGPGGSVTGVLVDGNLIPADVVVLALGPWMSHARAWVALPTIHALKGASIRLAADVPAQAVFSDYRLASGKTVAPEIFPRPGGEVYINGVPEGEPLPIDPDDITPSDAACTELHRLAGAHSSLLAAAPITGRAACYRPMADDGIPVIGPVPGTPGVIAATGHGSWGILNAPATGRMVAEMIMDGRSRSLDATPYSPSRLAAAMF